MTPINGSPASPPVPDNGGDSGPNDPSATVEIESIELRAGDDYTGRGYTIQLTSAADLAGKSLVIAAQRDDLIGFSLSAPITGAVGSQKAEFVPVAAVTCEWFPALYDGVLRILHGADSEETIWTGPSKVTAFPTPT